MTLEETLNRQIDRLVTGEISYEQFTERADKIMKVAYILHERTGKKEDRLRRMETAYCEVKKWMEGGRRGELLM